MNTLLVKALGAIAGVGGWVQIRLRSNKILQYQPVSNEIREVSGILVVKTLQVKHNSFLL